MKKIGLLIFCALTFFISVAKAGYYDGFKVSAYIISSDVEKMKNTKWLDSVWTSIAAQIKIDKVYIETYRDGSYTSEESLLAAKKYFKSKGVEYAGGITYTGRGGNGRFITFCYTTAEGRAEVKKIAELTARHFDEFILDDFFFNSCKCEHCTAAKGERSWTDFRLELMNDAAQNLVVGAAKAVNPKCKVIIKYPNWYEHFPALGFDLGDETKLFDGIWTGTETRDPSGDQHLQAYLGYEIIRYLSNIAPGRNGGGWVDPYGANYADRYAEQLWLTLFAKAPECTLFQFSDIQRGVFPNSRGKWQGTGTSFDFDKMGTNPTNAKIAAQAFETVNKFYKKLGNPIGIKSYKPVNSIGDDNLQNYLGMAGLPIEMVPEFPTDAQIVLLTEQAAADRHLVTKIKQQLKSGKEVIITSGLLKTLQKEISDIVELRIDERRAFINDFGRFGKSAEKILLPQVLYYTNDAWEDIPANDKGVAGTPLLLQAGYEKGTLWVLAVPDSYADIYELPEGVLNRIRTVAGKDLKMRLEGGANISLFVYDNNTFIVESFRDEPVTINVAFDDTLKEITDIVDGNKIAVSPPPSNQFGMWMFGPQKPVSSFKIDIKPHSFKVFKF